jgi:hypothetical protein
VSGRRADEEGCDHREVAATMESMEADAENIVSMAKADLDRLGTPI